VVFNPFFRQKTTQFAYRRKVDQDSKRQVHAEEFDMSAATSQLSMLHKHTWLVVEPTPLKNDGVKVSWDDDIPNLWKNHPFMFQTTNQIHRGGFLK